MTEDELEAAIVSPADQAGVSISPTLVTTLKQAVSKQPDSLPLLEHVLEQLWNLRRHAPTIDEADLSQPSIGGFEGALARHADNILDTQCQPAERRERTLALLTRLVHISNPSNPDTDTRARYPIDDADHRLLQPFIDAHLLVTSDLDVIHNGKVVNNSQRLVEVAHEALIRDWTTLKQAVQPKREFLAWRETIRHDLSRWLKSRGKPEAKHALLEGRDLRLARQWLKNPAVDFEPNERSFVEASTRQAGLRLIAPGLGSAAALAVLMFLAWVAWTRHTIPAARDLLLARLGIYWFVAPEMVVIPAEEFQMGAPDTDSQADDVEKPAHAVTVNAFNLGRYEVTFDEYTAYVLIAQTDPGWHCALWPEGEAGNASLKIPETSWDRGRRPVINVSWNDAQCYVQWLNDKTGRHFRLPTEAEWEYAARDGKPTRYWWGEDIRQDDQVWANCYGCGGDSADCQTTLVGSFSANPFGLYDTAGNVKEWVEDCYHDSYRGAPTVAYPAWQADQGQGCAERVIRGGSWDFEPDTLRSAYRLWSDPVLRIYGLGFRLAQD
jgi:formylglycine-generating enzyme required for sulfatase activity